MSQPPYTQPVQPGYEPTGETQPPYQGGYQPPYQETGGFQPPYQGTGAYQPPYQGTGGYQAPYQGTGDYQAPYQGTGGYQAPYQGTGGYQPPYPEPTGYEPGYHDSKVDLESKGYRGDYVPNLEGKFPKDNKPRDIFFVLLFILHLVGFVVVIVFSASKSEPSHRNSFIPQLPANQWRLIIEIGIICALVAVILGSMYLNLMVTFTKPMIFIGFAVTIITFLAWAIYFFLQNAIVAGVFMMLFVVLFGLFIASVKSRFPFAVVMLKTCAILTREYFATQVVGFFGLILTVGWIGLWLFTVYQSQKFETGANYFLIVFLIFSFYWTIQVVKNVVHVTVSGLFATWYFMHGTVGMPQNPTIQSFKRAVTTSFGSICLGSLIVALIQTLRAILRSLRTDHPLVAAIIDCFLSCIDSIVQYFNHYAFCQVAIYGKTFCQAAKATWSLFHSDGFEAIANDNIISGVLFSGCLMSTILVSILSTFLTWLWLPTDNNMLIIMGVFGAVVGFIIMSMTMQVLDSGVATIFVSFAEDKEALRRNHPELYEIFRKTYHHHIDWL